MKVTIKPAGNVKLSKNFYLSEFIESENAERLGIDNSPDSIALKNLFAVAEMMELVRAGPMGNRVIKVTSGYRGPKLNVAIGGSLTSDHVQGEAVDFKCLSFGTALEVARAIVATNIQFGQLIYEGTWVHMSLPNRGEGKNRQVLTAKFVKQPNDKTKAVYTPGLP